MWARIDQDFKDEAYLDLDLDLDRFLLRDLDLLRLRERERPLLSSTSLIRRPFSSVPSSLSIAFFKSYNVKQDVEFDNDQDTT